MKPAFGQPTIIYPKMWKGRPILSETAETTSIHHHYGTAVDGLGGYGNYAYIWNSIQTHYGSRPIITGDRGFNFWGDDGFGKKGWLIKPPKMIRILHNYGYYHFEHYPMTIDGTYLTDGRDVYDSDMESWWLTDVGKGHVEDYVNYYDLYLRLLPICQARGITLMQSYPMFFGADYNGPNLTAGDTFTTGLRCNTNFGQILSPYEPLGHPGRWLLHTIGRYPIPNVSWDNPPSTDNIYDFTPDQITGGEVLNIVFATDAYSAYHNNTHPDAVLGIFFNENERTIADTGCYESDMNQVKDAIPNYKKWGTILVNSPKNPEFFPKWYKADFGKSAWAGTCYILEDAQRHFQQAYTDLASSGLKILIRTAGVADNPALSGKREDQAFVAESRHLDFYRGPITLDEILAEVDNFWDSINDGSGGTFSSG